MSATSWLDAPLWLYVWKGMKATGFFLYLTLVVIFGVLDVIMFLLIFVNGLNAPYAR
jgi:hypothetical protein